jgi:hypothetical protein
MENINYVNASRTFRDHKLKHLVEDKMYPAKIVSARYRVAESSQVQITSCMKAGSTIHQLSMQ